MIANVIFFIKKRNYILYFQKKQLHLQAVLALKVKTAFKW